MPTNYKIKTRDEHFSSDGPKRILALDGGGLKGIVTLGFLERIEDTLRKRHAAGEDRSPSSRRAALRGLRGR